MGQQVSKLQIALFAGLFAGLIFLVLFLGGYIKLGGKQIFKVNELTFWGVFDDQEDWDDAIGEFSRKHPGLDVIYKKISTDEYEQEVLKQLANPKLPGPDVIYVHNTWLPKFQDNLQPFPEKSIPITQVRSTYPDVVETDFAPDGQMYALPLYLDTLALYYNKDIFNAARITRPPKTWEEFQNDVKEISRIDANGEIVNSAAAIGTARNINRSTDILALLMLQSGAKMVSREDKAATFSELVSTPDGYRSPGVGALSFYTDFANPLSSSYTWNEKLDYSIDAFYAGKTAMMFNYSHHIKTIRDKYSSLNCGVASMPQPKDQTRVINYPNYWGLAVTQKAGKATDLALEFAQFLTDKAQAQNYAYYTNRPVARRDLIEWQETDPDLGLFADQALTAVSWWQIDNSAVEKIFADMIDAVVLDHEFVDRAVEDAQEKISVLMHKAFTGR